MPTCWDSLRNLTDMVHAAGLKTIGRRNKMRINKAYILAGMVIAFVLFYEIAAHAQVLLIR